MDRIRTVLILDGQGGGVGGQGGLNLQVVGVEVLHEDAVGGVPLGELEFGCLFHGSDPPVLLFVQQL